MLISLHLPKTAGSSFGASLQEHFGDRFIPKYEASKKTMLNKKVQLLANSFRNTVAPPHKSSCLHGHFQPVKYRFCRGATFVTWLRDPVEMLASHYFYWIRTYDPETASPLRRRVVEEQWSLERFCLGPEMQNTHNRYLWGFPVKKFSFIGITEFYSQDFAYFCQFILGEKLELKKRNINESKEEGAYIKDPSLRMKIKTYHRKDVELYEYALKMRGKRLRDA